VTVTNEEIDEEASDSEQFRGSLQSEYERKANNITITSSSQFTSLRI